VLGLFLVAVLKAHDGFIFDYTPPQKISGKLISYILFNRYTKRSDDDVMLSDLVSSRNELAP
jgi:hypothetical protein